MNLKYGFALAVYAGALMIVVLPLSAWLDHEANATSVMTIIGITLSAVWAITNAEKIVLSIAARLNVSLGRSLNKQDDDLGDQATSAPTDRRQH